MSPRGVRCVMSMNVCMDDVNAPVQPVVLSPPVPPARRYAVYKYTARGLFERHKLLLSLQMCVRILQTANQVNTEEWAFFLKGGSVLDRSQQAANPGSLWISEEAWDNITVRGDWPGRE